MAKRKKNSKGKCQKTWLMTPTEFEIEEMRHMKYAEYLETPYWKALRNYVYNRDSRRCRLCDEGGQLACHHRRYGTRGKEDVNNLITLCMACHKHFHEHRAVKAHVSPRSQAAMPGNSSRFRRTAEIID